MPFSDCYAPWHCKAARARPRPPAHPRKPRHRVRRTPGPPLPAGTPAAVSRSMAASPPTAPAAITSPSPTRTPIADKNKGPVAIRRMSPVSRTELSGRRHLAAPLPLAAICHHRCEAPSLEIPLSSIGSSGKVLSVASLTGPLLTISIQGVVFRNNDLLLMTPFSTDGTTL